MKFYFEARILLSHVSNFELRLVIPFLLFLVLSLLLDKSGPAVVFVVAVSTDMHQGNQGLARALGVTIENPRFPNPSKSRAGEFIYWFYDAPHLLKLMRNWLLDAGFKLKGELVIIMLHQTFFT